MHFGLFLHRNRVITAEQLVAALELQIKHLVPIGQLALEEGILSARDIFDILHAQHDAPNERFGELAIELGRMTRDDLMRLLMIQADRKLPLEDILVWQGVLTEVRAAEQLNAFRRTQWRAVNATTTRVDRAQPSHDPVNISIETVMAI
jgi:hypothetical protein